MDSVSRRKVLAHAGRLGVGFVAGLPALDRGSQAKGAARRSDAPKLKVIVAGGHPGDPEYGCGGTIVRYSAGGHEVVLLYLNNGEWPSSMGGAPAETRMAEAKKACEILGARPVYAGQVNGKSIVDPPHYEDYLRIIQAERPDVVFSHWPIDNHADHRASWALTYHAWLKMAKRFALYYYEVSSGEDTLQFSPTHYVDITETVSRKRDACYAHASQTPDRYYRLQDTVAEFRGIESGHNRAEAYILQVESPQFTLPQD
jgi:LmbE family N-acetylglucosaminyl deacetylase